MDLLCQMVIAACNSDSEPRELGISSLTDGITMSGRSGHRAGSAPHSLSSLVQMPVKRCHDFFQDTIFNYIQSHIAAPNIQSQNLRWHHGICTAAVRTAGGQGGRRRWTPERLLLDPYAKHVYSRQHWATRDDREQYQPAVRPLPPPCRRHSARASADNPLSCGLLRLGLP